MRILSRYHANGEEDDELVKYEYREICHAIQLEEENKRTKYGDFVRTPGNRRRLLVLLTLATGTNWVCERVASIKHLLTEQPPDWKFCHILLPRACLGACRYHGL